MLKCIRGADKILSMYWFLVVLIISVGVFVMAYNFYGSPYDVREIEVNLLSNKVADCVSYQGRLNENLFDSEGNFSESFGESFLEECDLDFDVEDDFDWSSRPQHFVEIMFYDLDENLLFEIKKGNLNFRTDCFIEDKKGKGFESLPKCVEKRFYSLDSFDNQYLIKVLSSVGKAEKNVAQ